MVSKTFFSSDQHFGHVNVIGFENRPFADVEEMNEGLIERWNATVPTDGQTYILGDFIMGKHAQNLSIIERLNGKKFLIAGNHDKCWGGHKNYFKQKQKYIQAGVTWIADRTTVNFNGTRCILSHFPKRHTASEYDTRHLQHHEVTQDTVIHGHVHSRWKVDEENQQINVGVDVWDYAPVSLDTLNQWLIKWR